MSTLASQIMALEWQQKSGTVYLSPILAPRNRAEGVDSASQ